MNYWLLAPPLCSAFPIPNHKTALLTIGDAHAGFYLTTGPPCRCTHYASLALEHGGRSYTAYSRGATDAWGRTHRHYASSTYPRAPAATTTVSPPHTFPNNASPRARIPAMRHSTSSTTSLDAPPTSSRSQLTHQLQVRTARRACSVGSRPIMKQFVTSFRIFLNFTSKIMKQNVTSWSYFGRSRA